MTRWLVIKGMDNRTWLAIRPQRCRCLTSRRFETHAEALTYALTAHRKCPWTVAS